MTVDTIEGRPAEECLRPAIQKVADELGPVSYIVLGTGGVMLLVVILSYCLCSGLTEEEEDSVSEVKAFRAESF